MWRWQPFCDGVGHGILDRNAVGYFWDWKKELAVSGAVESYLGDFIKIKMKTGSMAYVMEHRLYGLFCVMRSGIRRE